MPSDPSSVADPPAGLDPSRLDIETRQLTLEDLVSRARDGEMDFVTAAGPAAPWSVVENSLLIESILIRVPLPAFYIDAGDEDRWTVIDGNRRLTAICAFVLDKAFALNGLEYLTELEGQGHDDLARALKRRLGETQSTVELIKPGTPTAIRYNMFRRINPRRTAQEVREAVFRGPVTTLIDAVADGPSCRAAIGTEKAWPALREAVLRFLAFFAIAHPPSFEPPLEAFLNRAMEGLNDDSLDGMLLRHLLGQRLDAAMNAAAALFDGAAFRAPESAGAGAGDFNPALFEIWSVVLARLDAGETDRLLARREEVIKAFTELLHDQGFAAATAPGTDDPASVLARFSAIHDLVGQFVNA